MSFSFECDRSGFTEHEIAVGLHVAMELGYWPGDEVDDERARPKEALDDDESESPEEALDHVWLEPFDYEGAELLISSLSTTADIRMRMSQYILEGEREQIAYRYSLRERLPAEFLAAALRSDALPILIKSFLRKILKIYPTTEVNSEIMGLSEAIRRNGSRRTGYERVGDIQLYLHRKADEALGAGAHLDLPNKVVRHLLSSSRLHIGLQDMFAESTAYWATIWDAETAASISEAQSPNAGFIPDGKRRLRLWRVPQMKPITWYASSSARGVLHEIGRLSLETPVDDYRTFALAALRAEPVVQSGKHTQNQVGDPASHLLSDEIPF